MQGIIIKGIGGFYYIKTENEVVECKARGKFRYLETPPMVGDKVEISIAKGKGVIEKILPRTSELFRPQVANVTQAFVVFALKNPDLNFELLNKFLIQCEHKNITPVICFNKIDLVDEFEKEKIHETFKGTGYKIEYLNAKSGIGVNRLVSRLTDNITVLCGPSGAGKSTLLNKLLGKNHMETGSISEKIGRGKHTTRHSELIEVHSGLVVDTPGFSTLELNYIQKDELKNYFPEFNDFDTHCKFRGCIHYKEPGCKVREAVDNGKITKQRYDFYIKYLQEISERRNNRW
ncbi:ribosome small subunit-dependent GTPase A [Clostridium polynesiense]|uniref:ribosome small subunit-dependent GTPase A n=1 Tax=Clostridium polynesiense TaxID=1325933 RepID=UPI00058E6258|nr:ribosome small subunit-dependent GTPase A [Clostridium polynesiense]